MRKITPTMLFSIIELYEDKNKTLWVSTLSTGLHYYDRLKDQFIRVAEFTKPLSKVMKIVEDDDGQLWICGIMGSHAFVAKHNDDCILLPKG